MNALPSVEMLLENLHVHKMLCQEGLKDIYLQLSETFLKNAGFSSIFKNK